MKKGSFPIRGAGSGMSALVDDVSFLNFVEWPGDITPIGPTRGKDDTTGCVLSRYLGPAVGVPC